MGRTAGVVGFENAGGRGPLAFAAGLDAMGYAGVANAGDEDGMGSFFVLPVLPVGNGRGAGARWVATESRSSMMMRAETLE